MDPYYLERVEEWALSKAGIQSFVDSYLLPVLSVSGC